MEDKLIIDISRIDPDGEELSGEVDCVRLDEEFVKSFGGIRYQLFAQLVGTELLVRGGLEQDFDLVCSRCGKDFDDTVKVDDFVVSVKVEDKAAEIDITDELRQSVILELSTYPVCSEACPGVASRHETVADDRWNVLDSLKQKQGEK